MCTTKYPFRYVLPYLLLLFYSTVSQFPCLFQQCCCESLSSVQLCIDYHYLFVLTVLHYGSGGPGCCRHPGPGTEEGGQTGHVGTQHMSGSCSSLPQPRLASYWCALTLMARKRRNLNVGKVFVFAPSSWVH